MMGRLTLTYLLMILKVESMRHVRNSIDDVVLLLCSQLLSWACEPGDCVVFHGMMLHGAKGNNSSSLHRRVLSTRLKDSWIIIKEYNAYSNIRWVGEGTTIAKRPWTVSPPILGGLNYGDLMVSETFPLVWGSIQFKQIQN